MDKIINWLLLIIIFVFDPLAISLVIAANFAFTQAYPKKKYRENLYGEKVEEQVKDMRKVVDKYDDLQDGMDIWDSTLQDGLEDEPWEPVKEEFNILDLNKDGVVDENETIKAQQQIKSLQAQLNSGISSWRKNKIKREINLIKSQLPNEDETKTY